MLSLLETLRSSELPFKALRSRKQRLSATVNRGPWKQSKVLWMADVKRPHSPEANGGSEIVIKRQRTDDAAITTMPRPAETKEVLH